MQFFIVGFLICFDIALAIFALAGGMKRAATSEITSTAELLWPSFIAGVVGGLVFFAAGSAIWGMLGAEAQPPNLRWLAISFGAGASTGFVISFAYWVFCILADGGDDQLEALKLVGQSTVFAALYLGTAIYMSIPLWSWML